mmetsp:Transcript_13966/g.56229  ORF Transcript_13966/g.56229 Transcript_13966/m.56229 type:complete len:84 (-) Transcript_13966:2636-2887(-)
MEQIRKIPRPTDVPDQGIVWASEKLEVRMRSLNRLLTRFIQACFAIFCGAILRRKFEVGERMIEEFRLRLELTLWASFCPGLI